MTYLADTNLKFVEAIKEVENNVALAKRTGEYKQNFGEWRWFPGKSPEGGLPTIAWGHKITPQEWSTKRIQVTSETSKDFRYGLTDNEATWLLVRDLVHNEEIASSDWDKYIGAEHKKLWKDLPEKYRGVLLAITFNSYLVKNGKWIWTHVAQGILANDDVIVTKGMVTHYHRPDGKLVALTSRAETIAKALGLPWQVLHDK